MDNLKALGYHGVISPKDAENCVMDTDYDSGSFLIWKPYKNTNELILTVKETECSYSHYGITNCDVTKQSGVELLRHILEYYKENSIDDSPLNIKLTEYIEDVNKKLSTDKRTIIAVDDFTAQHCSQLTFCKGDRLHLLDEHNSEWWYVHSEVSSGYIPSRFVIKDSDLQSEEGREKFGLIRNKSSKCDKRTNLNQRNTFNCNRQLSNDCLGDKARRNMTVNSSTTPIKVSDLDLINSSSQQKLDCIRRQNFPSPLLTRSMLKNYSLGIVTEEITQHGISQCQDVNIDSAKEIKMYTDADSRSITSFEQRDISAGIGINKAGKRNGMKINYRRYSSVGNSSTTSEDDVIEIDKESDSDVMGEILALPNRPLKYIYNNNMDPPVKLRSPSVSQVRGMKSKRFSMPSVMPVLPKKKLSDIHKKRMTSVISLPSQCDNWSIQSPPPPEPRDSFYMPADGIDCEITDTNNCLSEIIPECDDNSSNSDSGVDNSFCGGARILPLAPKQILEVWGAVSESGGIIQLPDSGISLNLTSSNLMSSKEKQSSLYGSGVFHPTKRLIKHYSGLKRKKICQNIEPKFDGRIVISKEDPPDFLNSKTQSVAGAMVRIDYANSKLLTNGAVLQMDVGVTLSEDTEEVIFDDMLNLPEVISSSTSTFGSSNGGKKCQIVCFQSNSPNGPFTQLKDFGCYHYGNTLQVTIDTKLVPKKLANKDQRGLMYIVPVVQLTMNFHLNPGIPVWAGISQKTLRVGVYGAPKLSDVTSCCVSLSQANLSPYTIAPEQGSDSNSNLHLWDSFIFQLDELQDLNIFLHSNDPSSLTVSSGIGYGGSSILITKDQLECKSRINQVFTLRCKNSERTNGISLSPGFKTPVKKTNLVNLKQKNVLTLSISGVKDGSINKMQIITPDTAPNLRTSSPIRRWNKTMGRPKNLFYKRVTHADEYLYLWYNATKETELKLRPIFAIPGANRPLTGVGQIITQRTRIREKGSNGSSEYLLQYKSGEVITILTADTLRSQGTSGKQKHWFLCHNKKKTGLVNIKSAKRSCKSTNHKNSLTAGELIESVINSVGDLDYSYTHTRNILLEETFDWKLFASILGFGENYIEIIMREMNTRKRIETMDKLSLFLEQFKKYCDIGSQKVFHKEVTRALLYMEEYEVVERLIAEFCLLSVANKISSRWGQLKCIFENRDFYQGHVVKNTPIVPYITCNDGKLRQVIPEVTWQPAYDYLQHWRNTSDLNSKSLVLLLHRAINQLVESEKIHPWTELTQNAMLILSIDTLKLYDTRL